MPPETINLLQAVPDRAAAEQFVPLLQRDGLLLEQIVSHGQASPEGFWYDQPQPEWVALLRGSARLEFDGGERPLLAGEDPEKKIRDLLAARAPYYAAIPVQIDTSDLGPEELAAQLLARWKQPG